MIVLAHRGFWQAPEEKNAKTAFARAFESGFGAEIDVRDLNGALVVSHDPPRSGCLAFAEVLDLYRAHGCPGRLAINIKADGLAADIAAMTADYGVQSSCFVFDMSVPDLLAYLRQPLALFTRYSEFEAVPSLLERAHGVWLDAFEKPWASDAAMLSFLAQDKAVALVSPELHARDHAPAWAAWKDALNHRDAGRIASDAIMICTDLPDAARTFFCEGRGA